jgi:hypothetical protein
MYFPTYSIYFNVTKFIQQMIYITTPDKNIVYMETM